MMSVVPFNVMGSEDNKYDKDARWWSTLRVSQLFFHRPFACQSEWCRVSRTGIFIADAYYGELSVDYKEYGSRYKDEQASPDIYSNFLTRYNVKTEVSATPRTGCFTFYVSCRTESCITEFG